MLNRMCVAVLALIGILISTYMAAYKFGFIGQVMCGTGGCETVQNSPWADFLGIPVPVIGLAGYGVLFVVALLGVQPRWMEDRRVAAVLTAAAVVGVLFSAYLSYLEEFVIGAWCRWCIGSAILAVLIFLCCIPEFRRLRGEPAA